MGWFITQSLAFIIIAALIGLAIGIWIGWLVWGRRAKGKHTAERAEAAARTEAASASAGTEAADPAAAPSADAEPDAEPDAKPDAKPDAEPDAKPDTKPDAEADQADAQAVPALAVAPTDAGTATDADEAETADAADTTETAAETEAGTAGPDVVAEAEAVARRAAETEAEVNAEATADTTEDTAAGAEAKTEAETPDDLRRIEGIGPKIAAALVAAGYPTYAKIAAATEAELREAVAGQGIKFAPSAASWADQAQYLVDNDADGLQEYQDYLVGGQERRGKFTENVDYTDVDDIEDADAKAAALAADEAAAAQAAAAQAAAAQAAAAQAAEPEPEPQDLRRIEGIGPKIDATLKAAGYTTYAKVAAASETELREALATGGIKFAPAAASWADQAQYLADGDEDGLQEYQDYLVGGQDRAAKFRKDVDYTDVDEIEDADAKAAALTADEARTATDGDTEAAGSEAKA